MTNEDYQLEELENAAVNKSNNAKRIAAGAGLLGVGGAAGYAATHIPVGETEDSMETITEEDMNKVAETGAEQVQEQVMPQSEQTAQTQEVHIHTQPEPVEDDQVDVNFDKTTHIYDEDGNLVATTEEGTIDGKNVTLVDVDGDMRADYIAYDADGNGVYNDDEVVQVSDKYNIAMGHATSHHEDRFMASNDPEPDSVEHEPVPYDIDEEKDYGDIVQNDFEDEKAGESYSHDYAEDNENYNNNANVEHYADVTDESADDTEYAYDDIKEESDYEDGMNDLADNDSSDDSFDDFGADDAIV